MGTILQERVPQQCPERLSISIRDWGCKRTASCWTNNRPPVPSNKMGRRQSQRKSQQTQYTLPSQENKNSEKKLKQRRNYIPNTPSTKHTTPSSQHSAQVISDPKSHPPAPAGGRMAAQRCSRREHKNPGVRAGRHTAAFPCHRPAHSSLDPQKGLPPNPEGESLNAWQEEGDSDTDLSESERLPMSLPGGQVPPQLELTPEVIEADNRSASHHRPRGRGHSSFEFPDFLPPPFNSWSLAQLAVFYNTEGRGAPRPRPVCPLERYLDRLLQLEWCQIQSLQEESGKSAASEAAAGSCHRSPATTSSRLSTPKCILQCQRAFPLTFLSSLASHSALLSSCACTLCRIRYSACGASCCRHARQSRLSPTPERRGAVAMVGALPKRSYSESRVHSSDRGAASRTQRFSSPVRTSSYLRRMQASGNLRNPVQEGTRKSNSTAPSTMREYSGECGGEVTACRTAGLRKRSGSEQRRGGGERQQGERRRSGSECRRGGAERRRTAELKDWEIKPDAVTAIMDNLPGSKSSPKNRDNRVKQVEFVT